MGWWGTKCLLFFLYAHGGLATVGCGTSCKRCLRLTSATLGHPNRSMGGAAQHPRLRLESIYQLLQCRIRYRFSNTHGVTSPAVFDRDGIRAHVCGTTG